MKCPDCNTEVIIPRDIEEGEVISCLCCGLEFEYVKGELREILLEGIDYGE